MTAAVRVTVVALAILVCGLAGMGVSLLTSPFNADPDTTSGGYFFLFLAAAVAGLTVVTVRGSFRAWLTVSLIAALIVLVPAAYWLSEIVDDLGDAPDGLIEFTSTTTATAVITPEASPALALGELSSYLVFLSAAGATVLLLLPVTRRALREVSDGRGSDR